MKIRTGRYRSQISFGIALISFFDIHKALAFDFGIWYIEFIFKNKRN